MNRASLLFLTLLLSAPANAATAETRRYVTIGTGDVQGVYFPAGGTIARLVNKGKGGHDLRAVVEATAGSVYNIDAVLSGELDFGLAQSDRQYQAAFGLTAWRKQGPRMDLRAVLALHPEALTLIVSAKSGIKAFADLASKRVSIGTKDSGYHINALHAIHHGEFSAAQKITTVEAPISESIRMLHEDRIDALFYTVGHPNSLVLEALSGEHKARLIPIPVSEKVLDKCPYYSQAIITKEQYPEDAPSDITTVGVKATLLTSANTPADIVYAVTRAVFENFDEFRESHPTFHAMTRKGMLEGNTAPYHPGALRYFKEVGLLELAEAGTYAKTTVQP